MEQAVKVFVSPTNDSPSFLESVSTQSNGHAEIICEKETDDHGEDKFPSSFLSSKKKRRL